MHVTSLVGSHYVFILTSNDDNIIKNWIRAFWPTILCYLHYYTNIFKAYSLVTSCNELINLSKMADSSHVWLKASRRKNQACRIWKSCKVLNWYSISFFKWTGLNFLCQCLLKLKLFIQECAGFLITLVNRLHKDAYFSALVNLQFWKNATWEAKRHTHALKCVNQCKVILKPKLSSIYMNTTAKSYRT